MSDRVDWFQPLGVAEGFPDTNQDLHVGLFTPPKSILIGGHRLRDLRWSCRVHVTTKETHTTAVISSPMTVYVEQANTEGDWNQMPDFT